MKIPIYNQIEAIGKEASADLILTFCNLMDLERLVSDSYGQMAAWAYSSSTGERIQSNPMN
jgi:hypothetical protein